MIKCTKFRSHEKNTLQGFADLLVEKWGVEIRGCKLFMKNGKSWVSLPSQEYEENGEKKYAPVIRFLDNKNQYAFSDLAKKAIEEFCREQGKDKEQVEESEEVPF